MNAPGDLKGRVRETIAESGQQLRAERSTGRFAPLAAGAAAVAAQLPALRNGYALDDVAIVAHPVIQSARTLWMALAAPWWFGQRHLYRPLTLLTIGLDRMAGGGAPAVPHALNLLLHGVVAALVTRLAARFLPAAAAITAGLLFALLPVHVEATASVVGRAELLSGMALVSLMLLVTGDVRADWRAFTGAALLSAAALASKESGAVAPIVALAAAHAWPAQRRRAATWAAAALSGTALLLAARVAVLGTLAGDIPHPFWRGMDATTRIGAALALLPRTAAMLFLPTLPAVEDVPTLAAAQHPSLAALATGVAMLLATLALVLRHRRAPSAITLGACVIAATIAPTCNLLFAAGALTARTLYAPSIGAALVSGWAVATVISALHATRLRWLVPALAGMLCVWGAALAWRESSVWRDTSTVVATMVRRHPDDFRGHELLAYSARDGGRPDQALRHFGAAIERFPADPEMLTDAATVALRQGDSTSATRWLSLAVAAGPRAARARMRLYGIVLARGDSAAARRLLVEGLRLEPGQRTWSAQLEAMRRPVVEATTR